MSTDQAGKIGILVANLGTPDSPSPKDVRRYLKEFLSDPRVIDLARIPWWFILNVIILNTRPKKTAAAYQKVWTEQGSPLLVKTEQITRGLQQKFDQEKADQVKVVTAMRYGNPSIKAGIKKLQSEGVTRILVFPLYPQFSATTTASTFDAVAEAVKKDSAMPELRFINRYYNDPGYLDALSKSVEDYWQANGKPDKLIMSLHGIPQDYVTAGDSYADECRASTSLLANKLQLTDEQWQLTFQSRLGPREWLQPYTINRMAELGKENTRRIDVICPGFAVDCLETLEEIAMENRDEFLEAGGQEYNYISCLNDDQSHIDALANIAKRHLQGWLS